MIFEISVSPFVNSRAGATITDDYDKEPMAPTPRTVHSSLSSSKGLEGNALQRISSTTDKTCVHVSQSGPLIFFGHSTSAFERPHDWGIYYEIVADSNESQERYKHIQHMMYYYYQRPYLS